MPAEAQHSDGGEEFGPDDDVYGSAFRGRELSLLFSAKPVR
jgi:hypothetical protein